MSLTDLFKNWNESRKNSPKETVKEFISTLNLEFGLTGEALKEKEDKLKEGKFAFYRALPTLFYTDLFYCDKCSEKSKLLSRTAPQILINGDIHLENFGIFRSPDGDAVWGINDFDQSGLGSIEWDLERLATSIVLAVDEPKKKKDKKKDNSEDKPKDKVGDNPDFKEEIPDFIRILTGEYFRTIVSIASGEEHKEKGFHGITYLTVDEASGKVRAKIEEKSNKEETTQKRFLIEDFLVNADDQSFKETDELIPILKTDPEAQKLSQALKKYRQNLGFNSRLNSSFEILAFGKLIGKGGSSAGLPRYCVLVTHAKSDKEPLVLEIKQLFAPSVTDQTGDLKKANANNVLIYQRSLNGYISPLTGAISMTEGSFLVREAERQKSKIATEKLKTKEDYIDLISQAARVLARSHAHTKVQAKEIIDWLGEDKRELTDRLLDFANFYANQTKDDFEAFLQA